VSIVCAGNVVGGCDITCKKQSKIAHALRCATVQFIRKILTGSRPAAYSDLDISPLAVVLRRATVNT
jgi:hypothetical protein